MSRKSYNVVSIIYYQTSSPKMNSRIWKVWAAPRKTHIFGLLGGADYVKLCQSDLKLNSLWVYWLYFPITLSFYCPDWVFWLLTLKIYWIRQSIFIFIPRWIFQSTTRSEPCQTSKMEYFAKTVNGLKLLIVFEKLHLRYSRGFWIILWC